MKYLLTASVVLSLLCLAPRTGSAQFGSIGNIIENTVERKVDQKVEDKTEEAMDSMLQNKKANNNSSTNASTNSGGTNASASAGSSGGAASFAAYNNYDFKPGENIIFEDHFTDDQDGEFPAHWDLKAGQGVVNRVQGEPAFLLTEGNYVIVTPRMTNESYLTDPFTVEFDYFATRGAYAPLIRFYDATNDDHDLHYGHQISTQDLNGNDIGSEDDYYGRWHHAAVIFKGGQLKAYLDNTRGLVVPRLGYVPVRLAVGGIGDVNNPISIRNFRVANGGSANTIGAMLTDGKFVTHGITFDVGKATLKPESMGVLNDVAKFMKENAATKFEIDGHTDADGAADKNMTLSQQRADAVKAQLVTMGVNASRLSTKGFGATKPIAGNDTPEGKANNRRVEFVKQ